MQIVACVGRLGRMGGHVTPSERRIAIDRFGVGFMRGENCVVGIRRERLPFIEFIDVDGTRGDSVVSRRGRNSCVSACRPVLGSEPIETHREHGDEREAQPDQHKGRGIRDHGNS
ncbi:hypothetical protein A8H31_24360 [Burkholderia thailandensis]|nr:hypothetical protein A8H31_24360 [Burkholderia thailandensis]